MSLVIDPNVDTVSAEPEVVEVAEDIAVRLQKRANTVRFRAMFEAHFERVCVALRRFGVPAREIEDAAQQVFVVAWNKLANIQPGHERAFLLGTAWNVASHSKRTQLRRREVWDDDSDRTGEMIDPRSRSDELVEEKQTRVLLDKVLSALPEDLRVVLVLHELEELSRDEIAVALGWRPGTVASRLERARSEFSRLSARALQTSGGRS
jgi:RNA polymerase sigma-70 factor (ECF subfamily)